YGIVNAEQSDVAAGCDVRRTHKIITVAGSDAATHDNRLNRGSLGAILVAQINNVPVGKESSERIVNISLANDAHSRVLERTEGNAELQCADVDSLVVKSDLREVGPVGGEVESILPGIDRPVAPSAGKRCAVGDGEHEVACAREIVEYFRHEDEAA